MLAEEGALRLLLESTRPALLEEVLADETSDEAEAARQCPDNRHLAAGAHPSAKLTVARSQAELAQPRDGRKRWEPADAGSDVPVKLATGAG